MPRRRGTSCPRAITRMSSMCSASHPSSRPMTRRSAARSTSLPGARCRRSRNRTTRPRAFRGTARCTWCRCRATPRRRRSAASGAPTECTVFDPGRPVRDQIDHGIRRARHDAHREHRVRGVSDLHAELRQRPADRSHRERDDVHRAAAHAPAKTPSSSSRIESGDCQLLVGPASSSRSEQMKVRDSTRATSLGAMRAR